MAQELLSVAWVNDDEEPRCKPMLIEILTTSRYEHEAARTEGGGGERRDGK
jgi:hypothetical protein